MNRTLIAAILITATASGTSAQETLTHSGQHWTVSESYQTPQVIAPVANRAPAPAPSIPIQPHELTTPTAPRLNTQSTGHVQPINQNSQLNLKTPLGPQRLSNNPPRRAPAPAPSIPIQPHELLAPSSPSVVTQPINRLEAGFLGTTEPQNQPTNQLTLANDSQTKKTATPALTEITAKEEQQAIAPATEIKSEILTGSLVIPNNANSTAGPVEATAGAKPSLLDLSSKADIVDPALGTTPSTPAAPSVKNTQHKAHQPDTKPTTPVTSARKSIANKATYSAKTKAKKQQRGTRYGSWLLAFVVILGGVGLTFLAIRKRKQNAMLTGTVEEALSRIHSNTTSSEPVRAEALPIETTSKHYTEQAKATFDAAPAVNNTAQNTNKTAAKPSVASVTAASSQIDDLTKIRGIGPATAALLNQSGITNFQSLSDTDITRLKEILSAGGPKFDAIDPATWCQQAMFLLNSRSSQPTTETVVEPQVNEAKPVVTQPTVTITTPPYRSIEATLEMPVVDTAASLHGQEQLERIEPLTNTPDQFDESALIEQIKSMREIAASSMATAPKNESPIAPVAEANKEEVK